MKKLFVLVVLAFFASCAEEKKQEEESSESGHTDSVQEMSIDPAVLKEQQIADSMSKMYIRLYPFVQRDAGNGEMRGFVPLTYIFPWGEDQTSQVIAPRYLGMEKYVNDNYHVVEGGFRKLFLSKAGIKEEHSVFIYHVELDSLVSFPVKDTKIVAFINPYGSNGTVIQSDFQIGFEFDDTELALYGYLGSFVAIGDVNPFAIGQMKPLVWTEMKNVKFPNFTYSSTDSARARNYVPYGNPWTYHYSNYNVFVRNLMHRKSSIVSARQVLVLSSDSGNVLLNKIFFDTEGSYLENLNQLVKETPQIDRQWTGKLLKYQPEVIYGFLGMSFDCPSVYFLDGSGKSLKVECDNRH